MKINFNEDDSYSKDTLVDAGKYLMQLKNFEFTATKRKGKKQLRCDLEILEPENYAGCCKQEYFPMEENALWRLKQFIAALTDVSKLKNPEMEVGAIVFEDLIDSCIGNSLCIYYGVEVFEGMERNYWRRYEKLKDEPEPEAQDK